MKWRIVVASLLLLLVASTANGQQFSVMEYNVENAFDTIHDEGKNDYEYLPDGERKWNKGRLFKKLRNIAKVIAAADEKRPVDLVALCEVENDTVLTYLTKRTGLRNMGYEYIMTNSLDERGIDVALLYSPFTFHPIDTQRITPQIKEHPTRDILHVAGTIYEGDTLDVYVVHLPSKLGGGEAKERSMKVTRMLRENIDSVASSRQKPNIIVMGDFNAEPHSSQLKLLTESEGGFPTLTDVTESLKPGTYKYKGDWSIIDHVLVHSSRLKTKVAESLTLPFLMKDDEAHGGKMLNRTYLGPIYKGGTSDHLPVVVHFEL